MPVSYTHLDVYKRQDSYEGVDDVDFATVWGQGHTMAERTGNASDNFIAWVVTAMQK